MSKRSNRGGGPASPTPQRITIGGITAVVLFVIVLAAQLAGIDVLNTDEDNGDTGNTNVSIDLDPSKFGTAVPIEAGIDGGWYQVYFTQPERTGATLENAPIERALIAAIDSATISIDAAIFEMNRQPVTDALLRAHNDRGVTVRIVTDGEEGLERPDGTIEELDFEGIPVVSDGDDGDFMHDKFFVIDGQYVWTGSTNITDNGMYRNNNNAIYIRSRDLAANYTAEFEELFAGNFGPTSPNNTPKPVITVNNTRIETFFESEGKASFRDYQSEFPARLVELLSQANEVHFLANVLSRSDLMDTMIARAESGDVQVWGVIEDLQDRFSTPLYCAGLTNDRIHARADGNPNTMHHKVFIIDRAIVVTGSFNFSGSAANDNDENILILYNPDIASAYLAEFQKVWAESQEVPADSLFCN